MKTHDGESFAGFAVVALAATSYHLLGKIMIKHRRELLELFASAAVTLVLLIIAAAPDYGPPYSSGFVEAAVRVGVGGVIIVPVTVLGLLLVRRIVSFAKLRTIMLCWLILCTVGAAWSWTGRSGEAQFHEQVFNGPLPSLRLRRFEQWTSFSDGSTWLFALQLEFADQQRLIDGLHLVIEEQPMTLSPEDPVSSEESWLMRWPAYQRPPSAAYLRGDDVYLVRSGQTNDVYIVRRTGTLKR